jgi:thiol-disulfide isomerase/thioredoxin
MFRRYCLVMAAFATVGSWCDAEETDARKLITDAMAYVSGLGSVSFDMSMSMRATIDGRAIQGQARSSLTLRDKTDLFAHIEYDEDTVDLHANAQKQFIHFVTDKQYLEQAPPKPRAQLIGMMSGGMLGMGTKWLAGFLHNDPVLLSEDAQAEYVGEEPLPEQAAEAGAPAYDHVRFKTANYDVELWLSPSPAPFLQAFNVDPAKAFAQSPSGQHPKDAVIEFRFTQWQPNPAVTDEKFAFTPPEGVTPLPAASEREEKDPLLGKPAPAINLDLLNGGKLDLGAQKGKNVVILDFWAAWCRPCRAAMPILAEVAKAYESRGVVMYAVNQGEEPERIKAFLEETKLAVTVALDPDGRAGTAYRVSGIPRMVIVDKEGVVRAGHSGVSPSLREDLERELDAILAGKEAAAK